MRKNKKQFKVVDVLEPKYELAVYTRNDRYIIVRKGNYEYLVDERDQPVLHRKYKDIYNVDANHLLVQSPSNDKFGVIDLKEQVVIPFEYDNLVDATIKGKVYFVATKAGKEGLLDSQGRVILPIQFEKIEVFSDRLIETANRPRTRDIVLAHTQGKTRIFNIQGRPITKEAYDGLDLEYSGILVRKKDKYGFLDYRGRVVVPFLYDFITEACNGSLFVVYSKRKVGLVDRQHNILLPLQYSEVRLHEIPSKKIAAFFVYRGKFGIKHLVLD